MSKLNIGGSLFGRQLKKHLIDKGMSIKNLAKEINTSNPYLYQMIEGKVNVSLNHIDLINEALQLSKEDYENLIVSALFSNGKVMIDFSHKTPEFFQSILTRADKYRLIESTN